VVVTDTIAPLVTVTSPDSATLLTGVAHLVQWTAADAGTIASFDVFFSAEGGVTFDPVAGCAALGGSVRSCPWSSPGPATQQGRIRVVARDLSGNASLDDSAFAIVDPVVTVTGPTAVSWGVGRQTIAWTHNLGAGSTVRVEASRDSGTTWRSSPPPCPTPPRRPGRSTGS
jgi:hypothetical protein